MATETIRASGYSQDVSPSQFTQALQTLAIPTVEASVTFTIPNTTDSSHAYIEWHRVSSFSLDNPRRFSANERIQPIKTITEHGIPIVTVDVYENRSDAGRGVHEFNEKIAPALDEAGYEPTAARIELTNRRFLGLKRATVVYENKQAEIHFSRFAGKKFRKQVTNWWHSLPTNSPHK